MTDVFDALAHPARRALLDELRGGPARAGDLGHELGISREAVSKHLRLMVQAGALSVETSGRERRYRINPSRLEQVDDWLEPYRQFWRDRLGALDTELARGRNHPHEQTRSPT